MIVLAVGCASAPGVGDPWAAARALLVAQAGQCFAGQEAFCLDDPAVVDPVLERVLDTAFHGEPPATDAGIRRWVRLATPGWAAAQLATPDARAAVERKIALRYAAPDLAFTGSELVADAGVLPGTLVPDGPGWMLGPSPLVADGEWTDGARMLHALREARPGADRIEVSVRIPSGAALPRWRYRWVSAADRIVVVAPAEADRFYVTAPLGGDWAPDRSLATRDLVACRLADERDPACPDPLTVR